VTFRAGFRGDRGPRAPGPPTIKGPPTKLLIFYFLLMNQLMASLQMFYCNLRVLLCTEIAAQEDFASPYMTSGGTSRGAKKISRLAIAHHIYIIRRLPQTPLSDGKDVASHSSSLSTPSASRSSAPYSAFTLATCCHTCCHTSCCTCRQCERTRQQVAQLVAESFHTGDMCGDKSACSGDLWRMELMCVGNLCGDMWPV